MATLGVLGDSLSDEYQAPQSAAAAARSGVAFFGPFAEIFKRVNTSTNTIDLQGLSLANGAAPSNLLVAPPGGATPTQCGFDNSTGLPACPTAAYQATWARTTTFTSGRRPKA